MAKVYVGGFIEQADYDYLNMKVITVSKLIRRLVAEYVKSEKGMEKTIPAAVKVN